MIKDNISKIKERIARICSRINRDPDSITIVAVSKGRSAEQIREAIEAGIADIGENKVQEALSKFDGSEVTSPAQAGGLGHKSQVRLHMVGHLQTNKAKDAVRVFDLIHSVDSLRLAAEIDKQAAKINKVQAILMEVNTSGETSKFGLKPQETIKVIEDISKLKNVNIQGLMTIAPVVDNPEKARPYFRKLREIKDAISSLQLSMGMTDDFEIAIEEGATMVRLGRAIFEG